MTAANDRATAPTDDEYAPYFARYVKLVPAGGVVATIRGQAAETMKLSRRRVRRRWRSSMGFRWEAGGRGR